MKYHLYRIGEIEHGIYVMTSHSPDKELQIRNFHVYNDSGDMPYETWREVAKSGKLEEITSIDQVPENHREFIPFCTDEWIEEIKDFMEFDNTIESFFEE